MGKARGDRAQSIDPVEVINGNGRVRIVLAFDQVFNFIRRRNSGLGLDRSEFEHHVARRPGVLPVARHMAALLDAPAIVSRFSRLVIHDEDESIARAFINGLRAFPGLKVGVNQPYSPADRVYCTSERHTDAGTPAP